MPSLDQWLRQRANEAYQDLEQTTTTTTTTTAPIAAPTTTPTTTKIPTEAPVTEVVTEVVTELDWWSQWWSEHQDAVWPHVVYAATIGLANFFAWTLKFLIEKYPNKWVSGRFCMSQPIFSTNG